MSGRGMEDERDVIAIHYNVTINRSTQMKQQHTVEKTDSERLKHECEDDV